MVIYANELETKEHKNKFWTPVGRVRREKKKKKSRSQFLASFQTFGLTARVYLNLRKNTDYFAV